MDALETREKNRSWLWKYVIPALIVGILAALFYILSPIPGFADAVADNFSRPVKNFMGTVLSWIPFSVMELEYVAAGVFVLYYLIRTVILTVKAEKKLRTLLRRGFVLLLIVAVFFVIFLWIFSIDYRSASFEEKSGIEVGKVKTEDLYEVTRHFLEKAAQLAPQVPRDDQGHWAQSLDDVLDASPDIYNGLVEEFPFLSGASREPKKMYLFSRLSSWMGFTGVYFPFTGESNINIDAPGCLIPSTVAHELAHQHGVYAEQEANFVGIAACLTSGNVVYEYSGYLCGAIHLSNALYSADRDAWRELSALITGPLLTDWLDDSAYWKQFEGKVEEVSSKVYDGYLKAQGQPLGIRSYGACVDLLVAYYLDAAVGSGE